MIDQYHLITVSHKSLNTQDLEHFILRHSSEEELVSKLAECKQSFGQSEILYLATCNRVVFFFYGTRPIKEEDLSKFLIFINPQFDKANVKNLDRLVELKTGLSAIKHLFEVAASIESLVIGEREIFRQFRDAYHFSRKYNLSGDHIRLVEKSAVKAAKDVYTNTSIGTKPVSIVSLAIRAFIEKQPDRSSRILLIGAGETNSNVGRFLKKHDYNNLVIFNRSIDNAHVLSDQLNAPAFHLSELSNYNEGFDCIFACTASQEAIINQELFDHLSNDQSDKLLVDLSIPHNISKEVTQRRNVDYISIDDLRSLAEENLNYRNGNVAAARIILSRHLESFRQLFERRQIEKTFKNLPSEVRKVKERALNLVYKEQIASLPDEAKQLINEIADYMEKKCVAVPIKMAKSSNQDDLPATKTDDIIERVISE